MLFQNDLLKYTPKANNFDFIRFVAACFVIISHAYDIPGWVEKEPLRQVTNQNISFSYIGLAAFFLISGFLITQSWQRSKTLKAYFANRILRIVPGLAVAVLCTILVYGPALTNLPIREYFSHKETYTYLKNILIFQAQGNLPGVFAELPSGLINGSLWTLPYEFFFYLMVPIAGKHLLSKRGIFPLLLFILLLSSFWMLKNPEFAVKYSQKLNMFRGSLVHFAFFFAVGSFCYTYLSRIVFRKSCFLVVLLCYSVLLYYTNYFWIQLISPLFLGYIIFCLGFWKSPLNNFAKNGDFSYGIYIYAYPIQMLCTYVLLISNPVVSACIAFLIVFPLAWLSWNFIEEPSLRLKQRIH